MVADNDWRSSRLEDALSRRHDVDKERHDLLSKLPKDFAEDVEGRRLGLSVVGDLRDLAIVPCYSEQRLTEVIQGARVAALE